MEFEDVLHWRFRGVRRRVGLGVVIAVCVAEGVSCLASAFCVVRS